MLAVPVCAPDAAARLHPDVDELVCPELPESFTGVGRCYVQFDQITDEEVTDLLHHAGREEPAAPAAIGGDPRPRESAAVPASAPGNGLLLGGGPDASPLC